MQNSSVKEPGLILKPAICFCTAQADRRVRQADRLFYASPHTAARQLTGDVVGVKVGRQSSGRAASEKDSFGGTKIVLLCQRLEDCVDDPLSTEVDFFAIDLNRLVSVSGKGVAIAVRQVYAVEMTVVLQRHSKTLLSHRWSGDSGQQDS